MLIRMISIGIFRFCDIRIGCSILFMSMIGIIRMVNSSVGISF